MQLQILNYANVIDRPTNQLADRPKNGMHATKKKRSTGKPMYNGQF